MYNLQPGKELRYYQQSLADDTVRALMNHDHVLTHLATGGGKTVVMASIVARFLNKYPNVTVVVTFHEHSLLRSMRRTLFEFYRIIASVIDADTITLRPAPVYVCMAQTLQNRIKLPSFQKLLASTGFLLCDEVHRGEHRDIEAYFKQEDELSGPLFLGFKSNGFTATPKNATPKDPLKNHYQEIVCGVSISELIEWNKDHPAEGLVQNFTYSNKTGIDRNKLKKDSRGEFDDTFQGEILKQPKYLDETYRMYEERCFGMKTIVFNSSIEHSEAVNEKWLKEGIPSRHLDGKNKPLRWSYDKWRLDCLRWLKNTDGATLHNCGVLGTGFDEPSIIANIINKFVNSMPHLIQIEGRSSRPYQYPDGKYKRFHIIVDMYGNNRPVAQGGHGDWSDERDWYKIFHFPKKPSDGIAPSKNCPVCGFINPASVRMCRGEKKGEFHDPPHSIDMVPCGYIFPEKEIADEKPINLKLITKNINVGAVIKQLEQFGISGGKYGPLKEMIRHNARKLRKETEVLTKEMAEELLTYSISQTKEYCKINAMYCTPFFKTIVKEALFSELKKLYDDFEYEPAPKREYINPHEP